MVGQLLFAADLLATAAYRRSPSHGLDTSLLSGFSRLWLPPLPKRRVAASTTAGDMLVAATNACALAGCKQGAASYAGEFLPSPRIRSSGAGC